MKLRVDIIKDVGASRLDARMEAESGAALALLGDYQSGKSVILRCVAGLDEPDEGRVLLDGEPLFDSSRHLNLPPQQRRIGYLIPGGGLFPNMTVRENIAAVSVRAERQRVTEEALQRFRLADLADRRPAQISDPERWRVVLARLAAFHPAAVLLDEPFVGLDEFRRFEMEQETAAFLADFDGPVIWATHDRGEAYRNCPYICPLENGVSQEIMSAERLITRPETESAARLSGCENIVTAIPRHNAVFLPEWGVTLRSAYPIPPLLKRVGIRARQVRVAEPDLVNAFAASVVRVMEDISATVVILRPDGAALDAPLLRMEMDRNAWRAIPDRRSLTISIGPQDVLLLR